MPVNREPGPQVLRGCGRLFPTDRGVVDEILSSAGRRPVLDRPCGRCRGSAQWLCRGDGGLAATSQAQVRHPGYVATSAIVVKVAKRAPFGKILTRTNGLSLYIHPGGPCNASCRAVWPPLLMPAGATTPLGAMCLATALLGSHLQVTYHGQRLFSFTGDSGTSVNGNGVAGFKVAKVTAACP
jgi:predicted lipoprotein with Yx(FWY)xxD motif